MDQHMWTLRTLVKEGAWCVFYATRRQAYWCLTHNVVFLLLLWFDFTRKNTQRTQGQIDWHTHIDIYLQHLLCAHSSNLYCIKWLMNNLLISKIYFPQCLFFSKIIHLLNLLMKKVNLLMEAVILLVVLLVFQHHKFRDKN